MATHGKLDEFQCDNGDVEAWNEYCERLGHYFVANKVTEAAIKKSILLSVCGARTYKLMRNLVSPQKPGELSYDDLVKVVKNHHNPQPSEIVERFKFNSRNQRSNETISEYVAELRRLSANCNFNATLEDMLRDRVVCGVKDTRIQRRLLCEKTLDFSKTLSLAQSMEIAEKNAQDLQRATPQEVNKVNFKGNTTGGSSTKQTRGSGPPEGQKCYRCGSKHSPSTCKFKQAECYKCKKIGHIAKACRSNSRKPGKRPEAAHVLTEEGEICDERSEVYSLYNINGASSPCVVRVNINKKSVPMEVDTGASVTILNEKTHTYLGKPSLTSCNQKLRTYTGEQIQVLGKVLVGVNYKDQDAELPALVVRGDGPCLLGRDWLKQIKLDWHAIFQVQTDAAQINSQQILEKYPLLFSESLGTLKGFEAKIYVPSDAKLQYYKPRPVPYSIKDQLGRELDRLVQEGTLEPVEFSEWAAPIVPIVKEDKSLRICGDYKVTVNRVSKLDNYPIPKTEDLLATLAGGEKFTKLDMSKAYQQLLLDEDSKKYTTINTYKGLFQYTRLPYGISSAPGIFQRVMEDLLKNIPNVLVRMDDILLSGKNDEEHLKTLEVVLQKLEMSGLRLNRNKCFFLEPEVTYLGQRINKHGVSPVQEKVKAISDAPAPRTVSELRSYLGMINYYNHYLPQLSMVLNPLLRLLKKGTKWSWGKPQDEAFQKSKGMLQSSAVLVHYDASKELILSCDASPYGVGAVLSHQMADGKERPIAFASRTLTPAEKNYSQLDKEALSVIFGVKKFHQYVYGRHFVLCTDHKPLVSLLNEHKLVPHMSSPRMQRWALTLSAYEYTIRHRAGKENQAADALSRLPVQTKRFQVPLPGETVCLIETMNSKIIHAETVKQMTRKDPTLSMVLRFVQIGWPNTCPTDAVKPFYKRKAELSVQDECILWGQRVVLPPQTRRYALQMLHQTHPGICRMKSLARSYIWWPSMDSDVEQMAHNCNECSSNLKSPAKSPLHPWEWPSQPWFRIHLDYAGPFMGKMFLIIVDAHSKWIDVHPTNSSTSEITIEKLRITFANLGLPHQIVTDNGSHQHRIQELHNC